MGLTLEQMRQLRKQARERIERAARDSGRRPPMDMARIRQLRAQQQAHQDAFEQAVQAGIDSNPCTPWWVLYQHAKDHWSRTPQYPYTRQWLIQWLAQQAIERHLHTPGAALLLLRVTAHIGTGEPGEKGKKPGYRFAWIPSTTLRAISGRSENAFERDRRALTAPIRIGEHWDPPLFRIELIGRKLKRRIRWVPLDAGWQPFIRRLDEGSRAEKEAARAARQAVPTAAPAR